MKKRFFLLVLMLTTISTYGQYSTRYIYKLLSDSDYKYIVGESSGERMMMTLNDIAGYELSDRNFDELKESKYIYDKLKEYGLQSAEMLYYPKQGTTWKGVSGTLWQVSPSISKIADYKDIPASLAPGSCDADVKAKLVWVNTSSKDELKNLDLEGKIVFGDMPIGALNKIALEYNAVGSLSCWNPRPLVDPNQIPNSGIGRNDKYKDKKTFGFLISPREGYKLRDRIKNGEKIEVEAKVKTTTVEHNYQSVTCKIDGTEPQSGEIIFSAHLYEGYSKLGANDNASGSAVLLEVARTLNTLIDEGKIARPKRTLRFIWGDEFGGIIPWTEQNKEIMDKALFAINLDMVGLALSEGNSYFNLHRQTMANSHYSSDLVESMFKYISITNQNSILVGNTVDPIIAPTGSTDPFYYQLTDHYGYSDHEIFNDWGVQVPAVMMITWPDNYYHTSGDRVSNLDATQLKRACVISASIAYIAGVATEKEALRIGGEVTANGARRFATQLNRCIDTYSKSKSAHDIDIFFAQTRDIIDATALSELLAVESIRELAPESKKVDEFIKNSKNYIESQRTAALNQLTSYFVAMFGKTPNVELTSNERKAMSMTPVSTQKVKDSGYGVLGMGTFRNKSLWSDDEMKQIAQLKVSDFGEAARLTRDGVFNILEIKKIIDTQSYEYTSINDLITFMKMLEGKGLIVINKK